MEGTNKTTQQTGGTKNNENVYKGTILVLVIIIGVLTFMLITSRQSLQDVTSDRTKVTELNLELRDELQSVLAEYDAVKLQYDSVLTTQDSIIQASAREIERLISRQEDYNRIRRQLTALREITQRYVHEIDSLYTENRVLKAENVEIKQEIQRVTRRTNELTETKELLEGKVEVAAALRAFQINAVPVRSRGGSREEETDRARRADRLKVCFTVAANPVARSGNKNAYIRIADPAGNILRISDDDRYAFVNNGDTLQYSVKGQFNYVNQDTNVCLYWDKQADFESGMYLVSIFTDEYRLGESQFSLR
jgi:vacuolar-type H+-ATPase subunit I/STV1